MEWNSLPAEPSGGFNLVMALVDGSWGAGKSFTGLAAVMHGAELLDATVLAIDSENRLGPYEIDYPRCSDPDKYRRVVTVSPLKAKEYIEALSRVEGQKILFLDSLSLFWPSAQELRLVDVQRNKPQRENLAMNDWPIVKKLYNALIDLPNQLGIHLLATGRQDDEYEEENGERVKVGVKVSGEKQTGYRFYTHLSMRPEVKRDAIGRKTQTGDVMCQVTKDNWHKADSHTAWSKVNPTGEDLAWLWTRLQAGRTGTPNANKEAQAGAEALAAIKPIGKDTAAAYAKKWCEGWGLAEDEVRKHLEGRKLEQLTTDEVLTIDAALGTVIPQETP